MLRDHFKIKTQLYFNDLLFAIVILISLHSGSLPAQTSTLKNSILTSKTIISLDGDWLTEKDPQDIGKSQKWRNSPASGAKKIKVSWIIQDVFPSFHGVVWYWRDFVAPKNKMSLLMG